MKSHENETNSNFRAYLMFFNFKSRSTFLDRPRAKSEELMVVKKKFPHQMPDAQKKHNNSTQWVTF